MPQENLPQAEGDNTEFVSLQTRCAAMEKELATLRHETAALWRNEQAFRQMIREFPFLFIAFDESGVVFHWNETCERVTGYTKEEMVANPKALELLYPDATYRAIIVELISDPDCELHNEEMVLTTKSGEGRVISWSDISVRVPIPGWKRWTIGQDVTDWRRAEDALTEANERMRALFMGAPDAVFVSDAETAVILDMNPQAERLLERCKEELIGKTIAALHPSGQQADHLRRFYSVQEGRDTGFLQAEIVTASGKIVPVEISPNVVALKGGKRVVQGFLRDVSSRKRAEEEKLALEGQLRHAQKMESIGRLAGGVAHDFNNLLTSISGNVELAMMELGDRDPLRVLLQEIGHAAESAAALTRQLLAFSRKQIIEPRVLDLNALIERMHKMLGRLIGEDVQLYMVPRTSEAQVNADPGQLEQVIINLAVNARDAMPLGGRLSLETDLATLDEDYCRNHVDAVPGEYIVLSVSDTGCGMSPEVKSHLFEPFFTTKPRGKGTGLGLATIYGVVKQNGGSIEVYSEVGRGTTFKIYLPRVGGEAKPLKNLAARSLALGQETILLVEDEQVVRDLANRFLTKLGYNVLPHANAGDALLAARNFPGKIHLLMTDVVMPGMNGPTLAEELLKFRPEIKVLFASGYTEDAIVHHGVLSQGVQFIGKPYSIHALANKLREVLTAS
ncbi:MAG: PAS domain S-box protein [Candidatus Hydrogenedentes bacterium]|nr:PAS domain S-box protein [Candidatus Hydrogenedentota bacterium]